MRVSTLLRDGPKLTSDIFTEKCLEGNLGGDSMCDTINFRVGECKVATIVLHTSRVHPSFELSFASSTNRITAAAVVGSTER